MGNNPTALLACLCFLLSQTPGTHSHAAGGKSSPGRTSKQIAGVVDGISQIRGLPPKSGRPLDDANAEAIVALGEKAAPYLVEKLTDASPSRVFYAFEYKIGDVALALLKEIYRPSRWPFPDGSSRLPQKYGDYRDYVA